MSGVKLPWWYRFKRVLCHWFFMKLLRRPPKYRNYTTKYKGLTKKECDKRMKTAIHKKFRSQVHKKQLSGDD